MSTTSRAICSTKKPDFCVAGSGGAQPALRTISPDQWPVLGVVLTTGSWNQEVEPSPTILSTSTLPPGCSSTTCFLLLNRQTETGGRYGQGCRVVRPSGAG